MIELFELFELRSCGVVEIVELCELLDPNSFGSGIAHFLMVELLKIPI
jgi:hypothetical protein